MKSRSKLPAGVTEPKAVAAEAGAGCQGRRRRSAEGDQGEQGGDGPAHHQGVRQVHAQGRRQEARQGLNNLAALMSLSI